MGLVSTLYQTETWTSNDGVTSKLEDLEPEHRENILNWLYRNRYRLHSSTLVEMYNVASSIFGDAASDMIDSDIRRIEDISDENWFAELPLVRRLKELICDDDDAVDISDSFHNPYTHEQLGGYEQ